MENRKIGFQAVFKPKWVENSAIYIFLLLFGAFIVLAGFKSETTHVPKASAKIKRERAFNDNWKFKRDSTIDASHTDYDDSKWRTLDLPHDFAIEDLPAGETPEQVGPFSKSSKGGFTAGYGVGGTGWYRKHFMLSKADGFKLFAIVFDGIMAQSDVWINGKHLGFHSYGYSPFGYDLTPFLHSPGKDNVIVVKARNDIGASSRWISGAGINRNVKLMVTDPVHIAQWGVHVQTINVSTKSADITLDIRVANELQQSSAIQMNTEIIDPLGRVVATDHSKLTIPQKQSGDLQSTIKLSSPLLWDTESPRLYKARITLTKNGNLIDTYDQKFGIREIAWNATKGLTLNGTDIKLKGGCLHSDNGILGTAAFQRAEERRVAIMKANGFNAIRSSHNQPSTCFLEACDKLGMLVLDEAFDIWTKQKNPADYHLYFKNDWKRDLDALILRDRDHPSVIFWSIGNEIPERGDSTGLAITDMMIKEIKTMDTTRPITEAVSAYVYERPSHPWSYTAPIFAKLGIGGYNYPWEEIEKDHALYPDRIMMMTESYPGDMYPVWSRINKTPYFIGDFVWTGMDYLGETGVGTALYDNEASKFAYQFGNAGGHMRKWPWYNAWCGDIDILGFRKPQSYYRDVIWNRSKLEMAVHELFPEGAKKEFISRFGWANETRSWTWPGQEGKLLTVNVYSRCTSVKLYLNGKLIDKKTVPDDPTAQKSKIAMGAPRPLLQLCAVFQVPYTAGELKAVAITDGKAVASQVLRTFGPAKKLVLKAEHSTVAADRNDLAYIKVSVADEKGNILPGAKVPVKFTLNGAGELAAAGNSGPVVASFQQNHFVTYDGNGMIIVRPLEKSGIITVKAYSEGLAPATTVVHVQ
jgi:beta-galactosidase